MSRKNSSNLIKFKGILFLLILLFSSVYSFGQHDTVYISSGEVLYGELKSLDRNVLTFDTDYADSEFKIDWDEVIGLASSTLLTVYTTDGTRITGNFTYHSDNSRMVGIIEDNTETIISLNDIVWFLNHERDFLQRIIISVDGGYTYTKSSGTNQYSATANINYTQKKWYAGVDFNRISSRIKDTDPTTRTNGNATYIQNLSKKIFALGGLELLENSAQNLNLRTTFRLGAGYFFKRTNALFVYSALGIANNHERFGGVSPVKGNSFEGMWITEFDAFNIGDFSFSTKWIVYPSFNVKGRVRIDGNVSLKYDLPLDFYIKFMLSNNYDSKPLIDIAANDFVIQTNIGWEWN